MAMSAESADNELDNAHCTRVFTDKFEARNSADISVCVSCAIKYTLSGFFGLFCSARLELVLKLALDLTLLLFLRSQGGERSFFFFDTFSVRFDYNADSIR